MRRRGMRIGHGVLVGAFLAWPVLALAVPAQLNVQGVLFNELGAPVEGATTVTFRLYDAADATVPRWEPAAPLDVLCEAGVFNALVPAAADEAEAEAFAAAFADGEPRWMGVAPGAGAELSERIPVVSVAYALVSGKAAVAEVAEVARGVDCAGCVPASALDEVSARNLFLAYDGNGSGLTATTYQAAIDELAALAAALRTDLTTLQASVAGLAAVATSGAYADLTGTPDLSGFAECADLAAVATSGSYGDLTGTPALCAVASSCAYGDLTGAPDLSGFAESADLAAVAMSGSYGDLTGTPDLSGFAESADLAAVATSGSYADLTGTPALCAVASSCAYADLTGTPDLSGFAESADLAAVATSGLFDDLLAIPEGLADGDDADTLAGLSCAEGQVAKRAGTAWECAADLDTDTLAELACAVGEIAKWDDVAGWQCAADEDTDTDALGALNCAPGQVPRRDADGWTCASGTGELPQVPRATTFMQLCDLGNDGTGFAPVSRGNGSFPSLTIGSDGLPVVAYYASGLRLARCGDSACSPGNPLATDQSIHPTIGAGLYPAVAIGRDGLPAVLYWHQTGATNRVLYFVHCGDRACSEHDSPVRVNLQRESAEHHLDLAMGANGLPILAYSAVGPDGPSTYLQFVACGDEGCNDPAPEPVIVDNPPADHPATEVQLAVSAEGLPIMAYLVSSTGLTVAHCNNPSCAGGAPAVVKHVVDSAARPGTWPAIAIGGDGRPIVAYWLYATNRLKVAKCRLWNCGCDDPYDPDDDTGCAGDFFFQEIPPIADQSEAYGVSLTVGADGLPTIAYSARSIHGVAVVKCSQADCGARSMTNFALNDGVLVAGYQPSITIGVDGLPLVAYQRHEPPPDGNLTALMVMHCSNPFCLPYWSRR